MLRIGFVVAAVIILFPAEAHLSGSSTVSSDSKYFRVSLESVRKIFAHDDNHPDQEGDWHVEWRKTNQPRADKLKKTLEPAIHALVAEYGLIPFSADYPEVVDGLAEDRPDVIQSKKPFQYLYRFGDVTLSVAFQKLPPAPARKSLGEKLERALRSK